MFVDIPNYRGHYKINKLGQVKSLKTGKILKHIIRKGYPEVNLCKDGKRNAQKIHRLLALTFMPNPENKPHINHKDSNRANYSLNNLEWVTPKENNVHGIKQGKIKVIGESHPRAKHTKQQVLEIRKLKKQGVQRKNVYKMYESIMDFNTFKKIWHNQNWKHLIEE